MSLILLITVAGEERAELTGAFSRLLGKSEVALLDVGRSVLHGTGVLTFMVRVGSETHAMLIQYAVHHQAQRLNVAAEVRRISEQQLDEWRQRQNRAQFIVTLLATRLSPAQLTSVLDAVASAGFRVNNIERLSARQAAEHGEDARTCLQIRVSGERPNTACLRRILLTLAMKEHLDLAVQEDSAFRTARRLVAFDMDSTLIQMEVIDELGRLAGVGKEVAAITELAMQGQLDFEASFRKRLALLKGLPARVVRELAQRPPVTPGTHRLMSALRSLGYKTAILSGGFTCFARVLQQMFGFDYVCANELEIKGDVLTGEALGQIVNATRKSELLRQIAAKEGIPMEQTVAVGDGANDIPMLSAAGLGIAFHAKPIVRESVPASISVMGLDSVLYLLGLRDRHIESLGDFHETATHGPNPPRNPLQLPVGISSIAS